MSVTALCLRVKGENKQNSIWGWTDRMWYAHTQTITLQEEKVLASAPLWVTSRTCWVLERGDRRQRPPGSWEDRDRRGLWGPPLGWQKVLTLICWLFYKSEHNDSFESVHFKWLRCTRVASVGLLKKRDHGAERRLRGWEHVALAEGQVQFPAPASGSSVTSTELRPKGYDSPFWPPRAHTYVHT